MFETALEPRTPAADEAPTLPGMSFLDHLEELRRRLVYSVIAVAVCFGVGWTFVDRLYGFMQKPIIDALHRHNLPERLVYLNPTEPFNLYIKIGLIAGLFLASPIVLYQVWAFIAPGLYKNERCYVVPFMFSTVGLFVTGGWFGYRVLYPVFLEFFIGFGSRFQPMITIGEYTQLFLTVILGTGVIFELPILVFFLALMGVVSAGWMWRNVRYSILVIFIVAGIVTPSADVLSMCLMAAPMLGLYVISIGIAYLVHPTQRKARAEKAAKKAQG